MFLSWECLEDVIIIIDFGECGVVVSNIVLSNFVDNCEDNFMVVYCIDDVDGNEIVSGLDDVSGFFFDFGISIVYYFLQDMFLLLIIEIIYDLSYLVDGIVFVLVFVIDQFVNGDYLEIINFNLVVMDVSCL